MSKLLGTKPEQVPTNAMLGTMAYQDANAVRVGQLNADGTTTLGGTSSTAPFKVIPGTANAFLIDASGNQSSNVNTSAPTLSINQQMMFSLTSNTNLRISVRGTDGTTRVANITLA